MRIYAGATYLKPHHLSARGRVYLIWIVRIHGPFGNGVLADNRAGRRRESYSRVRVSCGRIRIDVRDGIELSFAGRPYAGVVRVKRHVRQTTGGETPLVNEVGQNSRSCYVQKRTERRTSRRKRVDFSLVRADEDPPRSVVGMLQVDGARIRNRREGCEGC